MSSGLNIFKRIIWGLLMETLWSHMENSFIMEEFLAKDVSFNLTKDTLDYSRIVWINFQCGDVPYKRKLFTDWFTSPGDVILDWEEFKNSPSGTPQVNILLKLGGTQLPPAELILDRFASKEDTLSKLTHNINGCILRFKHVMMQTISDLELTQTFDFIKGEKAV